ncbi:hypothetical protein N7495_009643 [Penicillium taxi]|uniref:uncharacterized protein n=1 Tax=Penicillium taxi TaxID=168475 RepID=UPI002544F1CE|nr:uncharacterized protein N7495_009643 [Penicillium taxi]KAJ5885133.1 hypothetical protein N7495_009643 [Penicillium taxi]
MQPNHCDLLSQVRESRAASQVIQDGQVHGQAQPSGAVPMRSEDSWIEVSSQPSTSSLSSTATNDDIITTGLQVDNHEAGMYRRRRRRRIQELAAITTAQVHYSSQEGSVASSSQDEYEESESESDQPMSSSNEDIDGPTIPGFQPSSHVDDDSSEDEDDSSTALGMGISPSPFVPQPNIFSHPPVTSDPSWTRSHRSQPSEISNCSRRTAIRRDSHTAVRSSRRSPYPTQHSPYNMISPSFHADHDAALRASLSTLLSCAAAARGLPKPENHQPLSSSPPGNTQPSSFRLVGESIAMGEETGEAPSSPQYPDTSPSIAPSNRRHPHVTTSPSIPTKAKRRSSSPKDRNASTKKSRRTSISESTAQISPTVMTWVISAGVVVLFSAISFSAGYMLGREVARAEMGYMGDGSVPGARSSAACGQEAVRGGLKRFRWGTAAAGSASLA